MLDGLPKWWQEMVCAELEFPQKIIGLTSGQPGDPVGTLGEDYGQVTFVTLRFLLNRRSLL